MSIETEWNKVKDSTVYDPLANRIDFNMRKPTDYKLNKRITLPKPASVDTEFDCEKRRRVYLSCMTEYVKNMQHKMVKMKSKDDTAKSDMQESVPKTVSDKNVTCKTKNRKENTKNKRNGARREIVNLSKSEIQGLKSLKNRIKQGEVVVTMTDKSGRMAVVTRDQYFKSGEAHTKKDKQLAWNEVKYIQNQLNNHTWWLSSILGNSKGTDQSRMFKNIHDNSAQLPEMHLLLKDHKHWSENDNKPIPSRPVLSGNCCLNTHLSELVSEVIEPVSARLGGSEINSSEEALNKICGLNEWIKSGQIWVNKSESNILKKIGSFRSQFDQEYISNNDRSDYNMLRGNALTDALSDDEDACFSNENIPISENIINVSSNVSKILQEQEYEYGVRTSNKEVGQDSPDRSPPGESSMLTPNPRCTNQSPKAPEQLLKQKKLSDFWTDGTTREIRSKSSKNDLQLRLEHLKNMENDFKQKAKNSSSFSMALEHELGASVMWGRRLNLSLKQNVNEDLTYESDGEGSNFPPSLQNFSQKPIFLGADVVSLYPNMEKTHTGELIYRSVKECDISFNGIDYGRLAVYLFLVMGRAVMTRCGLEECIPVRLGKESNARSLGAKKNREISNWSINAEHFSEQLKREMLARLMQIQTIILMSSSCYTFGGKIYKQMTGAGIGERGSACIAKAMMSIWDKIWSLKQCKSGLWIPLLIRYVDDIRSYVFPINEGWTWNGTKWTYDPDIKDGLSYEERTRQELLIVTWRV